MKRLIRPFIENTARFWHPTRRNVRLDSIKRFAGLGLLVACVVQGCQTQSPFASQEEALNDDGTALVAAAGSTRAHPGPIRIVPANDRMETSTLTHEERRPQPYLQQNVNCPDCIADQLLPRSPSFPNAPQPRPSGHLKQIQVMPGDTLLGVARRFRTSPRTIAELNSLQPPYRLAPGSLVTVPATQSDQITTQPPAMANPVLPTHPPQQQQSGNPQWHRVQPQDTLLSIAQRYDVPIGDLISANLLEPPYRIQPGQELTIPQPIPEMEHVGASPRDAAQTAERLPRRIHILSPLDTF